MKDTSYGKHNQSMLNSTQYCRALLKGVSLCPSGETGVGAGKDRGQPPRAQQDEGEEGRWTVLHRSH